MRKFIYNFRKSFEVLVVMALLLLLLQIAYCFVKQEHFISYSIYDNVLKTSYVVDEEFAYNTYYLSINYDNNKYKYEVSTNYNKREKIVTGIIKKEIGDYTCVYPIYEKESVNKEYFGNDIVCSKDGMMYTSKVLDGVIDVAVFREDLKTLGYSYTGWTEYDMADVVSFKTNLNKSVYFLYWNYKTLQITANGLNTNVVASSNDVYENKYGSLVDHYYIIPDNINMATYSNISIIDIYDTKNMQKVLFETPLSTDSYVNGIADKKLYIFDKSNLIQYEIDPANYAINIVSSDNNAKYYDGKEWSTKSVYDFKLNNITFGTSETIPDYIKKYNPTEVKKTRMGYYFISDNNLYRIYDSDTNTITMIAKAKDMSNLKVVDDMAFYMGDCYIFLYDDANGNRPVFYDPELAFNSLNRYNIFKK